MINKYKEIGGDHYSKMKIEPIELIEALDLDFVQGCIVKYISRCHFKNGIEDLRKALHYCKIGMTRKQKAAFGLERYESAIVKMYCSANDIDDFEQEILLLAIDANFVACNQEIEKLITKLEEQHD